MNTMSRWGFGRRYLNFADRPCDPRAAFEQPTGARLTAARELADPGRMLRPLHDITHTPEPAASRARPAAFPPARDGSNVGLPARIGPRGGTFTD